MTFPNYFLLLSALQEKKSWYKKLVSSLTLLRRIRKLFIPIANVFHAIGFHHTKSDQGNITVHNNYEIVKIKLVKRFVLAQKKVILKPLVSSFNIAIFLFPAF